MPTVDPETVIGVRTPALRKVAKALRSTPEAAAFLRELPHRYYEENNLHGLLLSEFPGFSETAAELDRFLPFVDNWATCDLISPRAFRSRPPQLPGEIRRWLDSGHPYTSALPSAPCCSSTWTTAFGRNPSTGPPAPAVMNIM